MLKVFYTYPQWDAGVCWKKKPHRSLVVERHRSGPNLGFHLYLPTVAICLTPMSLRFAIYQAGMKKPTESFQGVRD